MSYAVQRKGLGPCMRVDGVGSAGTPLTSHSACATPGARRACAQWSPIPSPWLAHCIHFRGVLGSCAREDGLTSMRIHCRLGLDHLDCVWCCDEKGFNDDTVKGARVLTRASKLAPTHPSGKGLKHVRIMTVCSATGDVAPLLVVPTGALWRPEWKGAVHCGTWC